MSTTTTKTTRTVTDTPSGRTVITRTEAIVSLERGLRSLDGEIRTMESSLTGKTDADRSTVEKMMDDLKERRDRFAAKLREAKESGSEAWAEVQSGLNRAWSEIETAMRDARAKLS